MLDKNTTEASRVEVRANIRSFLDQTGASASEANKVLDALLVNVRGARPEPVQEPRSMQDDSLMGVTVDVRDEVQRLLPKLRELSEFL